MSVTLSAHELARTRFCAAHLCEHDATLTGTLCERCEARQAAGKRVELHVAPEQPAEALRCATCKTWKPDEEFPMRKPGDAGSERSNRRGRRGECRMCWATRRREWLASNRERANEKQRARRKRGSS